MSYADKIKSKEKEFRFSLFASSSAKNSDELEKVGLTKEKYNLICSDGSLKSGYGFVDLKMPTSETDLDSESVVVFRGDSVKAIWKLKWFDVSADTNKYYLFYFNDEGYICYDNMFGVRVTSFIVPNTFTQTPFCAYYRKGTQDALLLSGEGDSLTVLTGGSNEKNEDAPEIISICVYSDKLFAITASDRASLIYTDDIEILNFTDEKTAELDFGDERGNLQRLISFNDYLYIFRDYGITKLSVYGTSETFAVNHLYHSDSYIYPNSICLNGEDVYFLNCNGLKKFNGTSVSDLDLDGFDLIKDINQAKCYASIYDGKYYLACRGKVSSDGVGCENNTQGYTNNMLFVYDILTKQTDIVRGIDINMLLTFNNPFKSKLLACFNGSDLIGKVGQLSKDGKFFSSPIKKYWKSTCTDFGYPNASKRVSSFNIKSLYDCKVWIVSDRGSKEFEIGGSSDIQKIKANLRGNEFYFEITSEDLVDISNFVVNVSVKE